MSHDHEFDVERYLTVRRAYGASVSPDGRVAFLTDTTGVPQVWTVDGPEAWPDQRTFLDERVTFVDYSPTREEFVYRRSRPSASGLDPEGEGRTLR